jgi:hypothetical protein
MVVEQGIDRQGGIFAEQRSRCMIIGNSATALVACSWLLGEMSILHMYNLRDGAGDGERNQKKIEDDQTFAPLLLKDFFRKLKAHPESAFESYH